MVNASLHRVLQQVRRLAAVRTDHGLADRDLLDRFVRARDEAAFTVLVERHGPAVLGVCRRLLIDLNDAEDVCQATFLVLARKAGSLRTTASLAAWLRRVARSVAANLRRARDRRRHHEREARPPTYPCPASEVSRREAQAALDEELRRLPGRYGDPLVLCYLDGLTREEAARRLGLTVPALRGRLERGRRLLGDRLTRRGFGPAAGLPPLMLLATARAAVQFTGGGPPVASTTVLTLAREALRTMSLTKLKLGAAALLCAAMLLAAAGAALTPARDAKPPARQPGPPPVARSGGDPDADGDGLSDFQEVHKYCTDPEKKDTAGKGTPDGDWKQRREFAYSVRAVVRVMPPYNLKALNDDYQDVRVAAETKDYAELEVVAYPLNTNAEAIKGNPDWKKDYAGMKEYLDPGVTTNWDDALRRDLLRELAAADIDPDRLTDKEVVEKVSRWLFERCRYRYMFCTMFVGFEGGKPRVLPGLEEAFEREKGDRAWGVREQFEHELFGKEMFANKSVGTCTSAATLQATVLRALGIPTRMVLCIPLADASDTAQVEMVEKGLTHRRVRRDALIGLAGAGGFTSHTFCEAFVGGRWRRLNYGELGQNVLDRNYLGLMIHVHTFRDLSEANLAATWGTRYARGKRDDAFPHANPYRLLEVSDHFGDNGDVTNPPLGELKQVTIGKAYWFGSKEMPARLAQMAVERPDDGAGRLFFHGEEWLEDGDNYLQYKVFLMRADPEFVLKAEGKQDVKARLAGPYYTATPDGLRELEVVIPADELAKMARGVAYTVHPVNGRKGGEWKVRDGLTVTRE